MNELFLRLFSRPVVLAEVLLCSLIVAVLSLTVPLFVMQVLNRYVSYGVDATLHTLTIGVVIAIALEYGFRHVRLRLTARLGQKRDMELAEGLLGILTTARLELLSSISQAKRRELVGGLGLVQSAYSPANLIALLEVPFSLVFLLTLFLLSPLLGLISLLVVVLVIAFTLWEGRSLKKPVAEVARIGAMVDQLFQEAERRGELIRTYLVGASHGGRWRRTLEALVQSKGRLAVRQGMVQGSSATAQGVLTVAIIGLGSVLVVKGVLDIGTLIGANILAARALAPSLRLAQLGETMAKAEGALSRIREMTRLECEPSGGVKLKNFSGSLLLERVVHPLLISGGRDELAFRASPGSVIALTGERKAKSLLVRLLLGLEVPVGGRILIDGVDMSHVDLTWWRRQIAFVPREPAFLDLSVRENLLLANPEFPGDRLERIIAVAGIGPWLDTLPQGLDTPLTGGGEELPLGIRRRLAWVRALLTDGRLALLDDPTEGLEVAERKDAYRLLKALSEAGKTLLITTADPVLLRGASLRVELSPGFAPESRSSSGVATGAGMTAESVSTAVVTGGR
ncbi:MAG: ATP-binding cassette domain-containing protein [Magnetococcales bacterium]|nr:ATP-binding cassette domain-containing protein [Magnetococcales bacterium]MBF0156396.1 ATP-binding cassette domain-containing protein [Magnetococcales bacterium]